MDPCSSQYSRSSRRKLKKSFHGSKDDDEKNPKEQKLQICDKPGCEKITPLCFASSSPRCSMNSYTTKWYHMSPGEHCCQFCHDHFVKSNKEGNHRFMTWKIAWQNKTSEEPTIPSFMADYMLPFWIQCTDPVCKKWRQLNRNIEISENFIATFTCKDSIAFCADDMEPCDVVEDERVTFALKSNWIESLEQPPLLKSKIALAYLDGFYPDLAGISPYTDPLVLVTEIQSMKRTVYDEFHKPFISSVCLEDKQHGCVNPLEMDEEEEQEFDNHAYKQIMFLGVRNLIISLWHSNPTEWITIEKVERNLLCHGLARIRSAWEAQYILNQLEQKQLINYGLVKPPPKNVLRTKGSTIVVIGAGIAGLGAAYYLKNKGHKVIVLEARDRIGGRIWDTREFGACLGKGAQEVHNAVNNPITVICQQVKANFMKVNKNIDFKSEISESSKNRMFFHFLNLLEAATSTETQEKSKSLSNRLSELHQVFANQMETTFSSQELQLLKYFASQLEVHFGSNYSNLSALNYSDPEKVYYGGPDLFLPDGYMPFLHRLAESLDIRLNHPVEKVQYFSDYALVSTYKETFRANKVIVTVPVSILHAIKFIPPLPKKKLEAIASLGIGQIEKVFLKFPTRFWNENFKNFDELSNQDGELLFHQFTDFTYDKTTGPFIIGTTLCGKAVDWMRSQSDLAVVQECINKLSTLFPDKEVPKPLKWDVTRWYKDEWSEMAYSYIKVGESVSAYDTIAESINDMVYFAGEATFRQSPQSTTGAYLSGLREAMAVCESLVR